MIDAPHIRLRLAREKLGQSPRETAEMAGINVESYYDLESHSDEVTQVLSIREVMKLCRAVGMSLTELFGWKQDEHTTLHPAELQTMIKSYIQSKQITLEIFENRVGFCMSAFLSDPNNFYSWNFDCLNAVCELVGINCSCLFSNLQSHADGQRNQRGQALE